MTLRKGLAVVSLAAVLALSLASSVALGGQPSQDITTLNPVSAEDPVTEEVGGVLAPEETALVLPAGYKTPISTLERDDCGHCIDQKKFFTQLLTQRDDFEVIYIDITESEGAKIFKEVTELEGLSKSTPVTLVGNVLIQGFDQPETTGKRIIDLLDQSAGQETMTFEQFLAAGGSGGNVERVDGGVCNETGCVVPEDSFLVTIPLIGKTIDVKKYSLPMMSIILGFIDGFNPCAMWVLVTFLIVLLQVGNKRRMIEIAGLFILAEAVMYYLILNVWFSAWDFIGLDNIVTPIIGVLSLGGAAFFLYEGFKSDGACKVTNVKQRAKISTRIKELASKPMTIATALGVVALALSVNIIEFACSIGIPQAFTKVIEINQLGFWETQGMMALYILFYMIDDLIVFGIAFWGAEKLHLTTKYSKYSNILGGFLMLILGLMLIFAPNLLRF